MGGGGGGGGGGVGIYVHSSLSNNKIASLVCVGLLYLASFGTVLPPGIPQKLLWAIALWSGL